MTLEGDVVRVAWSGRTVRVRDTRGVRLLQRLVERPDEEVHVLALSSDEGGGLPDGDAGEALDARALRAYRVRLADLASAVDDASARADAGRLAALRHERDLLEAEVRRAVGLGGAARRSGSVTERARVNVQRRIKDAVARLAEADATVGRHFQRAVRTGTTCCYRP